MGYTFIKIAKVEVGSGGASTIDFNSIPTTYTDLMIKASVRTAWTTDANDQLRVQFNSDTGTNYSIRQLTGYGSGVESDGVLPTSFVINPQTNAAGGTTSTFASHEIYIPNYLGSNPKSVISENANEENATGASSMLYTGIWNTTSAINSITLRTFRSSGFGQYTTATLYGIKSL